MHNSFSFLSYSFFSNLLSLIYPSFHLLMQPVEVMVVLPVSLCTPGLLYQLPPALLHAARDIPCPLLLSNQRSSHPLAPPLSRHPGPSIRNLPILQAPRSQQMLLQSRVCLLSFLCLTCPPTLHLLNPLNLCLLYFLPHWCQFL